MLERPDVRADQDMKTKRGSKENSLPREGRHRDWSGHGNKPKQRGKLTGWRRHVRTGQEMETKQGSEQGELTSWRGHALEQIRSETKRSSKGNSRPREGRLVRTRK